MTMLSNIRNLDDASLGLTHGIVRIRDNCHIEIILVLAECDVGRAVSGRNFKDMKKFSIGRYFQNPAAIELRNV